MDLKLQKGDIFCVYTHNILGQLINFCQKVWQKDNRCSYSHAGLMVSPTNSFEALWKVKEQNIYEAYAGSYILIGRHEKMNDELFEFAFSQIEHYRNNWYPVHRIFLQLIPPLAKTSFGFVVCSELVAKFLYRAYILSWWKSMNPADLEDIILYNKGWSVVFEGKLE